MTTIRAFNKLLLWIPKRGSCRRHAELQHPEEAEKFYRELAADGYEGARGDGSQMGMRFLV